MVEKAEKMASGSVPLQEKANQKVAYALAEKFLEATVHQRGTDEEAVFETLAMAQLTSAASSFKMDHFREAVFKLLESERGFSPTRAYISEHHGQDVIQAVLNDEMSGQKLRRATAIYENTVFIGDGHIALYNNPTYDRCETIRRSGIAYADSMDFLKKRYPDFASRIK